MQPDLNETVGKTFGDLLRSGRELDCDLIIGGIEMPASFVWDGKNPLTTMVRATMPRCWKPPIGYKLIEKICAGPINVTMPLLQNVKYPYLESIAAMGFKKLYEDISKYGIRFAKSSRIGKLHECLGVRKSFLEIAQRHKLAVKDFDIAASYDAELSEEDFLWLATVKPPRELIDIFMQFCSVTEIRHYLSERMILSGRYNRSDCRLETQMTWWRDYLQMCFRLEHDMSDRKIIVPG